MTGLNVEFGAVLSVLAQYVMAPVFGGNVKLTDPHPDAPGSSAATFSVVPVEGDVTLEPKVKDALRAISRMMNTVANGKITSVEKIEESNEDKYVIIIKK